MAVSFFLGIDAGGTKTECVLADSSGMILARGVGGPANLRRTPAPILYDSLRAAVMTALHNASLPAIELEAVCAGFAGAGRAETRGPARELLAELTRARHIFIVGDMEVALEAAVGAGRGVILVAGTGSIAYGRNDLGRQARAGGHGPEHSDEGSATDIGRRAVQAAVAGRKSRHASPLARALCEQLGLHRTEDLSLLLGSGERNADLASLFPTVMAVARQGDAEARAILEAAGDALAGLALRVLRALQLEGKVTPVAVTGGVFAASAEVFEQVEKRLRESAPEVRVERLARTPAEGAVLLAQRLWLQAGAGARAAR